MLYETKQGSKAYEYIKGILDAEEKEYQAYMKRVEEAVGFEFEKWQGFQSNRTLSMASREATSRLLREISHCRLVCIHLMMTSAIG